MSTNLSAKSSFDDIAAAWLDDGPTELADSVLQAALAEVHATRQRQPLLGSWRTQPMQFLQRIAAAVAVIAVLGAGSYMAMTVGTAPSPSPATSQGPTAPTPTAPMTPTVSPTRLVYQAGEVSFGLTLPNGWAAGRTPLETDMTLPPGVVFQHRDPSFHVSAMSLASVRVRSPEASEADWSTMDPWPADPQAWLESFAYCQVLDARTAVIADQPATILDAECVVPDDATPPEKGLSLFLAGRVMLRNSADADYGWVVQFAPRNRARIVEIVTAEGAGLVLATSAAQTDFADAMAALDELLATLAFE